MNKKNLKKIFLGLTISFVLVGVLTIGNNLPIGTLGDPPSTGSIITEMFSA